MTYNPRTTPHRDAAALCGLALHPRTNASRCELRDATGAVVFVGDRWPDSWQFMEQHYGPVAEPALPADWYESKAEVTT
jgi:hypothetical protein